MVTTKILLAACFGSALVGGLVGGLGIASLRPSDAPRVPQKEERRTPSSELAEDVGELEARLAELEDRVASVQNQARSRQALEQVARALAEGEDPEAEKPKSAMRGVVDAEDPVFELAVRSVMDRMEWEKDEERRVNRARRQSERTERQTSLLQQRLQLNDPQSQAVTRALGKQMEQFRALRGGDGAEERPRLTRTEWRERATEIRKQTESELAEVLNDEQLRGYRTFVEDEGLGPRAPRQQPQQAPRDRAPGGAARQ